MPQLCIVAAMKIKLDGLDEYERLFIERANQIYATEPDVLLFQLAKNPGRPGDYYVIELYKDADAFKAHLGLFKNAAENQAARAALQIGKTEIIGILDVVGPSGLKTGAATMAIIAELPVKNGESAGFEEASMPMLDAVQSKEDGNLLYCLGKHRKESKYIFAELYTDVDAITHHGGTDYFKAGAKRQGAFMDGKPTIKMLHTVGSRPAQSAL